MMRVFWIFSLAVALSVGAPAARTAEVQPTGWTARTLPEIAEALAAKRVTSVKLVEAYLSRIARIDRAGPRLRSIISINPDAMAEARRLDSMRAEGKVLGPLHGVPVLLKDIIESKDRMATTAGSLALRDNVTGRDSPLVAGLRRQGAIILGKTNLSEWANYRSEHSLSGWSALGGQVKNPHVLDRSPCGSSSGSAAAAAASLAAGTVGTETNGSIICPANVNGIVGFKPTVGLVSQRHIVPLSPSQDTAGPMTKTVKGAAMLLNAMATGRAKRDYLKALEKATLQGKRIGLLRFDEGSNPDIKALFLGAVQVLRRSGAHIVEIKKDPGRYGGLWDDQITVLDYEFKSAINSYLASTPKTVKTRTLDDLIAFNKKHAEAELALFGQDVWERAAPLGGLDTPAYVLSRRRVQAATREAGIDAMLAAYRVDILIAPSGPLTSRIDTVNGDVWPPFPSAGSTAAIAGYPHATVPMGAVHGIPLGISFIGARDRDAEVLAVAHAYEQASNQRVEPAYLPTAGIREEIAPALEGLVNRAK
jgi:amidase